MEAYASASSVGWLDFDEAASERVATMLRALEEPGTLDALGIGSIRDAFADLLSPGTSTIQTRLRYFIFLPWILKSFEAERVAPQKFAQRLRDREAQLIDRLRAGDAGSGLIGAAAGRNLQRLPSEIYWGGLGRWGIRRLDLSLPEYAKRAASLGRAGSGRDDDGNPLGDSTPMWMRMPDPPDDFLQSEVDFQLTRAEADLLVDQLRERCAGSLLAALAKAPNSAAKADYPWEVPTDGMTEELKDALRHARCFSVLTVGPQEVYNLLLARRARTELGRDTEYVEEEATTRLGIWASEVSTEGDTLINWARAPAELWALLEGHGRIPERAKVFATEMCLCAARDPDGFAEDDDVHESIRLRELQLKGRRARLAHRSALETWNGAAFGGRFDFRWGVTARYLKDLAEVSPTSV